MKRILTAVFASLIVFIGVGCETIEEAQARQLKQVPFLVAEKDGVKLWKVSDVTPGGQSTVYFTTGPDHKVICRMD